MQPLTHVSACRLSVVFDGERVEDDVSLRNAGVGSGALLHIGISAVPDSVLRGGFGDNALLRAHCDTCGTPGAIHKVVPLCRVCFRETVMLSTASEGEVSRAPTRVHGEQEEGTASWIKGISAQDFLDLRCVCAHPECGSAGIVRVPASLRSQCTAPARRPPTQAALGFVCSEESNSDKAEAVPASWAGCSRKGDPLCPAPPSGTPAVLAQSGEAQARSSFCCTAENLQAIGVTLAGMWSVPLGGGRAKTLAELPSSQATSLSTIE